MRPSAPDAAPRGLSALLADTLAKRLFALMWIALVGSHTLAWGAVRLVYGRDEGVPMAMPTLPSLPPGGFEDGPRGPQRFDERTPPPWARGPGGEQGREQAREQGREQGREQANRDPGERGPGGRESDGLPGGALALDYAVRLVTIALAAAFGARWLSQPMKRLVDASRQLGAAIPENAPAPLLDQHSGVREVRDAAAVFNQMARELRGQFQGRGLMIAAISHDLRTPLTRIRMRLEMSEVEDAVRDRCIADIREMNHLVDSVLDAFRDGDAGALPLAPTDVGALVASLVDDLAEQGRTVEYEPVAAIALADSPALRRVLGNLLDNALRHASRVAVRLEQDTAGVQVFVEDDGPGIPEQRLEQVLQPFYRLDPSRSRETGGAGLGLFIARDLARRMGGELILRNRDEGGLQARISLGKR